MIKKSQLRQNVNEALKNLSDILDVSPAKYEDAKKRYEAVGHWLNDDDELALFDPQIYPQGSFALGTAIKPINNDDYDVDAVCLLKINKAAISQQKLKEIVGNRLKKHGDYKRMLDPKEGGRRCWTIKYADDSRFHLDILPAIPDEKWKLFSLHGVPEDQTKDAICITDKETWNTASEWPKSNPRGYLEWFKDSMRIILKESRERIALEKRAQVHEVPDYEVRTPLQRAIQLFKRHRDKKYSGDEDKPISIIITTLAAKAYNNEANLLDAILNMVPKMRDAIEYRNGVYWVPNPVNPEENFADKWSENPRKKEIFFQWLNDIEITHHELINQRDLQKTAHCLAESYGERDASIAMKPYIGSSRSIQQKYPDNRLPRRFDVHHREKPKWSMQAIYSVSISARYKYKDQWNLFENDSSPLPKFCDLLFLADTDTPSPFSVYWQVVNTGKKAQEKGQLRGQIFIAKAAGLGGIRHKEETKYTGMHWIECFIVKNGICVARSGEFVVNIQ